MITRARNSSKTSLTHSDADSRWDYLARLIACYSNVEVRRLADLKRHPKARLLYSPREVSMLADGLERTGLLTPLIVDSRNRIIAGLHNYEAAKRAGLKLVPVIRTARLSQHQKKALRKQALEHCGWYGGREYRSTAPLF